MPEEETATESVIAAAVENLRRAIQLSPEWRDLETARMVMESDQELAASLARYRALSARWREVRAQGRALAAAEALELAEVQEKIRQHPLTQRQQQALAALISLLQRINQALSQDLGFDFAAVAAPRGGGCCG